MTPSTIIQPTFHIFTLHSTEAYNTNINRHTVKTTSTWPHRCHSTAGPMLILAVFDTYFLTSLLTSYSHRIVTHHYHYHLIPHYQLSPPPPSLPAHKQLYSHCPWYSDLRHAAGGTWPLRDVHTYRPSEEESLHTTPTTTIQQTQQQLLDTIPTSWHNKQTNKQSIHHHKHTT